MNRDELFKKALKENDKMIYRICCRFFGSDDNAKDAYQEVLLRIWQNIESFRGESLLKTWISRISVNVCITFAAMSKRKSSLFIRFADSDDYPNLIEADPCNDDELKMKFFREFMSGLNASDRILVSLYLEDTGTKEIAEITGLSESNVRVKIHRIKNQIKNKWEMQYGS